MTIGNDFHTVEAVAELLGVSRVRVRQLLRGGRINGAVQVGGVWLVPKSKDGGVNIKMKNHGRRPTWMKKTKERG